MRARAQLVRPCGAGMRRILDQAQRRRWRGEQGDEIIGVEFQRQCEQGHQVAREHIHRRVVGEHLRAKPGQARRPLIATIATDAARDVGVIVRQVVVDVKRFFQIGRRVGIQGLGADRFLARVVGGARHVQGLLACLVQIEKTA